MRVENKLINFPLPKGSMWEYCLTVIFFLIISIPFFFKLGISPLRQYDEAFYALQAFEWAEHGEYLKSYDVNTPLLNTKPYLLTWIQAASYKVFGYTNFALRFPVALLGWFSCILCWAYLYRIKAFVAAYMAAFLLATSTGFLELHMARTGDHDVPLAFFLLLNLFCSYLILEDGKTKTVYFIAWSLSLAAAVLTKGILGFSFIPGILMYAIYTKKLRSLLSSPSFYISIGFFLLLITTYYIHREIASPGYLTKVWDFEIGRFFLQTHQEHPEFNYFFRLLYNEQFFPWLLFVPIAFVSLKEPSTSLARLVSISAIAGLVFLLIISFSKVKLRWYDASVIPVLCILAGLGIAFLIEFLANRNEVLKLLAIGVMCLVGGIYYSNVFTIINRQQKSPASEKFDPALFYMKENYSDKKKMSIVTSSGFNPQVKYLISLFNDKFGYQLILKKSTSEFLPGEMVLISEAHTIRNFSKRVKSEIFIKPAGIELRIVE